MVLENYQKGEYFELGNRYYAGLMTPPEELDSQIDRVYNNMVTRFGVGSMFTMAGLYAGGGNLFPNSIWADTAAVGAGALGLGMIYQSAKLNLQKEELEEERVQWRSTEDYAGYLMSESPVNAVVDDKEARMYAGSDAEKLYHNIITDYSLSDIEQWYRIDNEEIGEGKGPGESYSTYNLRLELEDETVVFSGSSEELLEYT